MMHFRSRSRLNPAAWLLALLLLFVAAPGAMAQSTVTDDDINAIAKELYCPVCESTPLDVCPTQACTDWRNEIRRQLEAGASEQEIKDYFVGRYGDRVLASPRTTGVALWVWLLPIILVGTGGLVFARFMRNVRRAAAPPARPEEPDEAYLRRIEEELNRST